LPKDIGVLPDFESTIDRWANDEIGVISYFATNPAQYMWALDEYRATHPGATFEDITLGPPLGTPGKQNFISFYVAANWVVPKTSEAKVPAILDLINFLGTAEGQDLTFYGIEGVHYTRDAGGEPVFNLDEWNEITSAFDVGIDRCMYPGFAFLYSMTQKKGDWEGAGSWVDKSNNVIDYTERITGFSDDYLRAQAVTDAILADVGDELPAYYAFISLSAESIEIRTRLREISLEYLPAFITGRKDIDAEWPNYVKAYDDAGVQKLVDDFNAQILVAKEKYEALTG
jgi:ABC-type glycerol-3-phosphate transport system substrate-binding protein